MELFLIALVLFPACWLFDVIFDGTTENAEKDMHDMFGTGIIGFILGGGAIFLFILMMAVILAL